MRNNNLIKMNTNDGIINLKYNSIKEFDITKELGKGKYGCVKIGRHKLKNSFYAIKMENQNNFINKDKNIKDEEKEINYLREKTILWQLTNTPNCPKSINRISGFFEDSEYRYLVLELVQGSSLSKYREQYRKLNKYILIY